MKKPWITKGMIKSIEKKNRIYRKCIRTKNATKKRNCTTTLNPVGILLIK